MKKSQREPNASHFDELLTMIYESSIDSKGWYPFLLRLSEIIHSNAAMLRVQNLKDGKLGFKVNTSHDDFYFSLYQDYYYQIDPLVGFLKKMPAGRIYSSADILDYDQFKNTEFFVDYLHPQSYEQVMGGFIEKDHEIATTLGLQRSFSQHPFSDGQIDLVQRLVPHLKRALRIGRHIDTLQAEYNQKSTIINQLHTGVIMLDQQYNPLWMNASADRLIEHHQGLNLGKQGLQAGNAVETKMLRQLLDAASSVNNQTAAPVSGQLLLNPTNYSPLILLAMPYSESMSINYAPNSKASIILLVCQQSKSNPNAHILEQLFHLTSAETRLLKSVGRGDTLEQYAAEWHVTKNTARSQLRAVLGKTQFNRQADLVLLYQQIRLNPVT